MLKRSSDRGRRSIADSQNHKIRLFDERNPLDISMRISMLGNYAEYRALYPDFFHDGSIKINIGITMGVISSFNSPLHAYLVWRGIDNILANLGKNDQLNKQYSYD